LPKQTSSSLTLFVANMDLLPIATCFVALVASIGSSIAGGGGGLLISPYMILIGLPPQVAVATPKLAGLGLAIGSVQRFARSNVINWRMVVWLAPISIVAGIVGPQILVQTSQKVVGYIVIAVSISLSLATLKSKVGLEERQPSKRGRLLGYALYSLIAILQAAFGSGIGSLIMFVFMGLLGMNALAANATKRVVGVGILIPASIILFSNGLIDVPHGIAMLLGMYCGGWIGAHIAINRGSQFIRTAFIAVTIVTAITAAIRF